jgi:hypothetical protein
MKNGFVEKDFWFRGILLTQVSALFWLNNYNEFLQINYHWTKRIMKWSRLFFADRTKVKIVGRSISAKCKGHTNLKKK